MATVTASLPYRLFLGFFLQFIISQDLRAGNPCLSYDTCNRPFSLDSNFSILRWPFSSGSWTLRNSWKGANEPGGEGSGWGQGRHFGSHYYAVDWNKVGSNDCDSIFYAPMGGTVIFSYWSCSPACVPNGENCRGNEVVIQSNIDTSYAFSVLHLNMVLVNRGKIVKAGDPLGTIGTTGFSTGPHAHCVLFKKINRYLTGVTIGIQSPDEHAAPFDFSADCGGDGTNNINLDEITAIDDPTQASMEKYFSIKYTRGNISIQAVNDPLKKFSVELFNGIGQKFLRREFIGEGDIYLPPEMKGIYILAIQSRGNRFTKKVFVNREW